MTKRRFIYVIYFHCLFFSLIFCFFILMTTVHNCFNAFSNIWCLYFYFYVSCICVLCYMVSCRLSDNVSSIISIDSIYILRVFFSARSCVQFFFEYIELFSKRMFIIDLISSRRFGKSRSYWNSMWLKNILRISLEEWKMIRNIWCHWIQTIDELKTAMSTFRKKIQYIKIFVELNKSVFILRIWYT